MHVLTNKTTHYNILFLDIIGFSQSPIIEQNECRERFDAIVNAALKSIAPDDRIIVETGEGTAIALSGATEKALFTAFDLCDGLAEDNRTHTLKLNVRIGINAGPVRIVKGINDQPNILGEGIDVAQNVMSLAKADQILVSGTYLRNILGLTNDFTQIFAYEAVTGKNKGQDEAYLIHVAESAHKRQTEGYSVSETEPEKAEAISPESTQIEQPLAAREIATASSTTSKRTVIMVASSFAAAVIITLSLIFGHPSPKPAEIQTTAPAPTTAEATAAPAAKPTTESSNKPANKPPVSSTATVQFAVSPWGEIYVDGVKKGIAPPLTKLTLDSGKHTIELRNPSAPAYQTEVDLKAGDKVKIKHKFE
jgi:hypothetical protein